MYPGTPPSKQQKNQSFSKTKFNTSYARQHQQIRNMSTTPSRRLNIENINPHVRAAQYAVRGELAVKSEEFRVTLASGKPHNLPFNEVVSANIGNPQQLDQKPITFFRQVLSLLENPILLEKEDVLISQLDYKPDVIERAKWLLSKIGSVGAYSASNGAPAIRQSVAEFLESESLCPVHSAHMKLI